MNESIVSQVNKAKKPVYLNWQDDPAIQKLLDVVIQILAEEYIETAKNNPECFKNKGESHESSHIC